MTYALLFPGQGSQSVGMLAGLDAPAVAETWAEASEVLGWDLAALVTEGPAEELNRTERTQPALLAAGVAVWRVWQARAPAPPTALAGHSLGEYSALVAAGSLDFGDALKLVERRGQLMQAAVPAGEGGMVALIGLDDAAAEALCRDYSGDGVLEPANYNAPGQVVVAGDAAALDWLTTNAKAKGARMAMRLPMSVPSHCSRLREAAAQLHEALAAIDVRKPEIPVLHNLDAEPRESPEAIRAALRDQLFHPVRWTQTLHALAARGIDTHLECGPGKVLSGLVKRTLPQARFVTLEDSAGLDKAIELIGGPK